MNNRTFKIIGSIFLIIFIGLAIITTLNYFNKKSNINALFEFKEVAYSSLKSEIKLEYDTINLKTKDKVLINDSQNKIVYLLLRNIPLKEVTSNIKIKSDNSNKADINFNIQKNQEYAEKDTTVRVYKFNYSILKLNIIDLLIDDKIVPIDFSAEL
ncbi:hypothetical protein [Clostridium sp.]|uniref:hypothetical protein n=1 Tax=Clostridium sp. TaxID=1506 RepID=UPI001A3F9246|nr:hypothetical protein [Clostridium sp.]MBK5242437.1 hypothetical protein [Clostridium sp.]